MEQTTSNSSSKPVTTVLECNKFEAMEEAMNTEEDFLKFVNELPISIDNKISLPIGVRIYIKIIILFHLGLNEELIV